MTNEEVGVFKEAKETKWPEPKWWLATAFLLIALGSIMFFQGQDTAKAAAQQVELQAKQRYGIEAKILLNQMQEYREFNSQETWDLNVWLPVHNRYMQNYYNYLLEYNDATITTLAKSLEKCLNELYLLQLDPPDNPELREAKVDECNLVGRQLDQAIFAKLTERVGELE